MISANLLRSAVAGGVLILALAGCGDDDEPTVASTVPGATGSVTNRIEVKDFRFNPEATTVRSGATVTWTFADPDAAHSVEPVDPSSDLKASADLENGATYEAKLTKVGTVEYRCGIHNSMRGSIVVTP